MKIIVSSEAEKTLIKNFLELVHDEDLGLLLSNACERLEEYELNHIDLDFIENGLFYAKIEVDPKVEAMEQSDDVMEGNCCVCGAKTCGTIDGDDVSYEEYLHFIDRPDEWYCESCFKKRNEEE